MLDKVQPSRKWDAHEEFDLTAENLQAAYGGRLATAQVDQLARALG